MAVSVYTDDVRHSVTIAVQGPFDFTQHEAFRRAYRQLPRADVKYVVDLSSAETMDSTALGLLLLLRDYAGGDDAEIRVENCKPNVREVLRVASFDSLFTFA